MGLRVQESFLNFKSDNFMSSAPIAATGEYFIKILISNRNYHLSKILNCCLPAPFVARYFPSRNFFQQRISALKNTLSIMLNDILV